MENYEDWSADKLEAEYRSALDAYERDMAEQRRRLLDLRRARDAALEAMTPTERGEWEQAHSPYAAAIAAADDEQAAMRAAEDEDEPA